MAKRVSFASQNVLYSPKPSSPSPSLSFSSLPSSSSPDLPTPPPEQEGYAPATYAPTPKHYPMTPYAEPIEFYEEIIPKHVQIHRMLGYHPAVESGLPYDLSLPPEVLEEEIDPVLFSEPATSPPFAEMIIQHPSFVQDVRVVPITHGGGYVSVFDVLVTLHRELRVAIKPKEYAYLPDDVRPAVDAAYFSRCQRVPDLMLQDLERSKGIKRIDLLIGHTRFLGLSGTLSGSEVWELNVS